MHLANIKLIFLHIILNFIFELSIYLFGLFWLVRITFANAFFGIIIIMKYENIIEIETISRRMRGCLFEISLKMFL